MWTTLQGVVDSEPEKEGDLSKVTQQAGASSYSLHQLNLGRVHFPPTTLLLTAWLLQRLALSSAQAQLLEPVGMECFEAGR